MNVIPLKISQFKALLKEQGLNQINIDEPLDKNLGEWFIDIHTSGELFSLSFQKSYGFGFYQNDAVYGEKPSQFVLEARDAVNLLLKQIQPKPQLMFA